MGYPFIHIWLPGFNPSEKYEFVSWAHDIPNIWENKIHVPNQPDIDVWDILLSISGYVVSTPLKNMSSSVGIIIPNICKNKIHVPNQPDIYI